MKLAVALAFLASIAAPAAADSRFDPFASVSAGVGYSTSEDAVPLVSVTGGALLRPDLLVFAEGWTQVCHDSRSLGAGVRYWPWRKVWISYAAGVARHATVRPGAGCFPDEFKRHTGIWTGSRLGTDLTRSKYFALELSLSATHEYFIDARTDFDDEDFTENFSLTTVGLEFGVSFY
jgi:hypothetical protein